MRFLRNNPRTSREGSKHRSQVRVVGYTIEWPEDSRFEHPVRRMLAACPSVTEFGTHECGVWFNGWPSAELRAVRNDVIAFTGGRSVRGYTTA